MRWIVLLLAATLSADAQVERLKDDATGMETLSAHLRVTNSATFATILFARQKLLDESACHISVFVAVTNYQRPTKYNSVILEFGGEKVSLNPSNGSYELSVTPHVEVIASVREETLAKFCVSPNRRLVLRTDKRSYEFDLSTNEVVQSFSSKLSGK